MQTLDYLKSKNIMFAMSRVHHPLPELLEHYELLERIGKDHLYATNRDAVEAYERATGIGLPPGGKRRTRGERWRARWIADLFRENLIVVLPHLSDAYVKYRVA